MTTTTTTDSKPARAIVTLAINGAGLSDDLPSGYEGERTAQFYAFESRYTVRSDRDGTIFHGKWWNESDAQKMADMMGLGTVLEAETYWYVPTFGRVESIDELA